MQLQLETNYSKLLSVISNTRDRLICKLLYETGSTVSQVSRLVIKQVNGRILNSTYNGKPHKLELTADLSAYIHEYSLGRNPDDYIFSTGKNRAISTRRIEQIFKHYSEIAAVDLVPRDLRKNYIRKNLLPVQRQEALDIKVKTPRRINLDEIRGISIDNLRDKMIFAILCATGCKLSEAVNLKKKHLRKDYILFGDRQAFVSKSIIHQIKRSRKDLKGADYIISGASTKISERRVQQILTGYSKKLGLKITSRIIRNSLLYEQYNQGIPVEQLKQNMGLQKINVFTHGLI